jgi:hypothetical protein
LPAPVRVWALLIAVAFAVGLVLRLAGALPHDPMAPLHADPRLPTAALVPAAGLGALLVWMLPVAADRLEWRRLLVAGWLAAIGWTVALAVSDGGAAALGRPLAGPREYLDAVPTVGDDPLGWLGGFTAELPGYPTHVQGHPPLPVLFLWALQRIGLGGAQWAGAIIVAIGCSAAIAVAITVRAVAGPAAARRTLPFVVLAPYAVWVATSMDALFLGVGAWAVALIALAAAQTHPRPPGGSVPSSPSRAGVVGGNGVGGLWITGRPSALTWAFVGGVLVGALPYLSYGLVPLLIVPVVVLILLRPPPWLVGAVFAGATTVVVAVTGAGFWWPDGVAATAWAWATHPGGLDRPYWYFAVANFAVLGLITGPAVARVLPHAVRDGVLIVPSLIRRVPGLVRTQRAHPHATPVGELAPARDSPAPNALAGAAALGTAALVALVLLDLSGVTRGEVERIWLPYAAWVVAVSAYHRPPARGPLAAQVIVGVALQAFVGSMW